MRIRARLLTYFVGIALLASMVGGAALKIYWDAAETIAMLEAKNISMMLVEYLVSKSGGSESQLYRDQADMQKLVSNLHGHLQRDFEIVDTDARILADVVVEDIGTIVSYEEVKQTITDGLTRTYLEVNEEYPDGIKEMVMPLKIDGSTVGAVVMEYTPVYDELQELARTGLIAIAVLSMGVLVIAITLGNLATARIAGPIRKLKEAALSYADGKFVARIELNSQDELGELAFTFNKMAAELKSYQEELVRKEKLAVLGQVAGSVGHELRNPLGVMSNAVFYLQTVLADADDSVKEYLNIIKSEIAGSERIVSDLLDSVRTKPPHPETVGVRELIDQTLRKCTVPSSVTVKLGIPATLPPLRVDAMQIHQVFRNLISNGIEAMTEGGVLEIGAVENKPEGTITVSVRDSGAGIAPEVLPKLFQPLFTTKARGIGLGLVVVKNLTEANGGSVGVKSELGKGSTFTVTLPCGES